MLTDEQMDNFGRYLYQLMSQVQRGEMKVRTATHSALAALDNYTDYYRSHEASRDFTWLLDSIERSR